MLSTWWKTVWNVTRFRFSCLSVLRKTSRASSTCWKWKPISIMMIWATIFPLSTFPTIWRKKQNNIGPSLLKRLLLTMTIWWRNISQRKRSQFVKRRSPIPLFLLPVVPLIKIRVSRSFSTLLLTICRLLRIFLLSKVWILPPARRLNAILPMTNLSPLWPLKSLPTPLSVSCVSSVCTPVQSMPALPFITR